MSVNAVGSFIKSKPSGIYGQACKQYRLNPSETLLPTLLEKKFGLENVQITHENIKKIYSAVSGDTTQNVKFMDMLNYLIG